MEQLTTLVSSRGLLRACHSHNLNPISSSSHIEDGLLDHHTPGKTIYVCTEALIQFATHFFPKIKSSFVLVSGDSDKSVNQHLLHEPAISAMVSNELLLSWFAQNLTVMHPKLVQMPIGLDYHTMWERPGSWGISSISGIAQEQTLFNIFNDSPAFNERYLNAYCNWKPVPGWGDREDCYSKIDRSICLFESSSISRRSTWQRQSEFMYVISPEGIGMDCHRTWEAIMLGCIPIIKRNALSSMYAELPVLIVEDWSDVTPQTLSNHSVVATEQKFNFSSLFKEHWTNRFNDVKTKILDPMKMREFRKFLTRKTG